MKDKDGEASSKSFYRRSRRMRFTTTTKRWTMRRLRIILRNTPWLLTLAGVMYNALGRNRRRIRGRNNTIESKGALARMTRIAITGSDNLVRLAPGARLRNVDITICGDGHQLVIGAHARVNRTEFAFEDNGCRIILGPRTTIDGAHIAAAEPGREVIIGEDCMLSRDIYIATTDSHSIVDCRTGERVNPASNITVGDHVWIGQGVRVMKGVNVADQAVIGGGSVVTRDVPAQVVVAGNPARVVRRDVTWTRERS